jgi:hypothetical protein
VRIKYRKIHAELRLKSAVTGACWRAVKKMIIGMQKNRLKDCMQPGRQFVHISKNKRAQLGQTKIYANGVVA